MHVMHMYVGSVTASLQCHSGVLIDYESSACLLDAFPR